jgi:hypothetical protein
MGPVYVEATIRAKRKLKTRFLVDTGAMCSLISPELAKQVGMEPSRLREKVHFGERQDRARADGAWAHSDRKPDLRRHRALHRLRCA